MNPYDPEDHDVRFKECIFFSLQGKLFGIHTALPTCVVHEYIVLLWKC